MNLDRAQRLRQEGHSWNSVARLLRTTIYKLKKAWMEAELPPDNKYRARKRKGGATQEMLEKAELLRSQGVRWKTIAERLDVDLGCLEKLIYKPRRPPSAQVISARNMRKQKARWKEIGRLLGRDPLSIQAEVNRYVRSGVIE